jgi:hypothetical protein
MTLVKSQSFLSLSLFICETDLKGVGEPPLTPPAWEYRWQRNVFLKSQAQQRLTHQS